MDITEATILHHVAIVLLSLWLLSSFNWCHPVAYFIAFIYLYLVHEFYVARLRKKVQAEEKRQANQRRVLADSETVRWLNHAIENIWPICMEQICSQTILLPIIPWFLEKYKPWTAEKAVVQHLYMGRNPPFFTEMRVLRQCNDDHLVLELGMNLVTADDMSAILAVKLRKTLGFGMWAKLHITGMHVEGKVLVGIKFLRTWPYLGRLRVCFAEPPYFRMTVKPLFHHGLDVTEVPGIAGWLDKLLSIAFEQTLVEPNMLVVDVEKFASQKESWFSVDEKEPVAHAKIEVLESLDMKPSDLNGLADPYVKGHIGAYKFRTKTQRKTLSPKWYEEFKIPIITWESPNILTIQVRDKDRLHDDNLGDCSVNLSHLRDGQRHDMWLSLQNIKTGRLRLAITILEDNEKEVDNPSDPEKVDIEERRSSSANDSTYRSSFSSVTSGKSQNLDTEKSQNVADNFEPIDIEGQKETGIWVHHPGSEVSQTWEPRKGRSRCLDTEIQREPNDLCVGGNSIASGSLDNNCSNTDNNHEGKFRMKFIWRSLRKIGSVFHRSPKGENKSDRVEEDAQSHVNIRAVGAREHVEFVMEDDISGNPSGKVQKEGTSSEGSGPESPGMGNVKGTTKNILKHAEKSARGLKHDLSCKSGKSKSDSLEDAEREIPVESNSYDDESPPASVQSPRDERDPVASQAIASSGNDSFNYGTNLVQTGSSDPAIDNECPIEKTGLEESEKVPCPDKPSEELVESTKQNGFPN